MSFFLLIDRHYRDHREFLSYADDITSLSEVLIASKKDATIHLRKDGFSPKWPPAAGLYTPCWRGPLNT